MSLPSKGLLNTLTAMKSNKEFTDVLRFCNFLGLRNLFREYI
jgi:hypothetical protein